MNDIASVPTGSTVVFFVLGATVDFGNFGTANIEGRNVIFYFNEATSVKAYNVAVHGGFLAPNAAVTVNDGRVNGWLYAKSFTSTQYWHVYPRGFTMSCDSEFSFLVDSIAYILVRCPYTGEIIVNNDCVCPSSQQVINGACGTCPYSGQVVVNQQCICAYSGQVIRNNACACPYTGQVIISNACSCPSGYKLFGGVCEVPLASCPLANQVVDTVTNNCVCKTGYKLFGGVCEIPLASCPLANQVVDTVTNNCVCKTGYKLYAGVCEVPLASCPLANQVVDTTANRCVCKTGYNLYNGVCEIPLSTTACPVNTVLNTSTNRCVCPSGYGTFDGVCEKILVTCPYIGQIINTTTNRCICPTGQDIISGKCGVCPYSGQIISNQTCICPTGQDIISGKCGVCPYSGQIISNQTCICPTGQSVVNGKCDLQVAAFNATSAGPTQISSTKDYSQYLSFQTKLNLYWSADGTTVKVQTMSGIKDPLPFLFFMRTVSRLITYSFKACYIDELQKPVLETYLGKYNVTECANAASARNFKFFGIQAFGHCHATNSESALSTYGVAVNHYCMFECSLDRSPLQKEQCGKDGASAVYELSYAMYTPVSNTVAIGDSVRFFSSFQ